MNKLIEDLRIGLLGAAAGLFSSSVLLLIERIDSYYAFSAEGTGGDFHYTRGLVELWWVAPTFFHVLLSVAATLLVHRYLSNLIRSPFLLWQTIGITTLFGWVLTGLVVVGLQCLIRGNLYALEHLVTSMNWTLAKYVSVVFACNVFYGSVIDASSRQYAEQFESD